MPMAVPVQTPQDYQTARVQSTLAHFFFKQNRLSPHQHSFVTMTPRDDNIEVNDSNTSWERVYRDL
jgi:hypothetical protein